MAELTEQSDGTENATAAPFTYPSDNRDGWEPGTPSLRAMAPSAIGGGLIPLAVYYSVRHAVSSDAVALAIAGIPAAGWVLLEWARKRRLDPIGAIVLFGFVAGVTASFALGGNAFVLKVRDALFTCLFGLVALGSVWLGRRPLMFYIGRALSAGTDPHRLDLYDQLWELPPARVVFKIITVAWGVGLIGEAVTKVLLAIALPTGAFLAASPVATSLFFAVLFAFTVGLTRWSRKRTEAWNGEFPADGGSWWWWMRFWIARPGAPNPAPAVDLSHSE